jgi:serine/threonine protein kinase/predicted Zn-dependent protease
MSVTDSALPFGTTLKNGKYRLEGVLGQGGFGITYRAIEVQTGVVLAIKELFPDGMAQRHPEGFVQVSDADEGAFADLIEHMRRERSVLAQITHSATTFTLDYWEELGTSYLAMEFLEGETLEARIARGDLLSNIEAMQILKTILGLLEGVHLMGLLHRDIKPANIIQVATGFKLIDFGSATPFVLGQRIKITSRLLTPAYAPLEQYGQEVMIGPATDLYALAATLYEALTGSRIPSALDRVNGAQLIPLAAMKHDLDSALVQVIEAALEMRVDARPQSAKAMIRQLHMSRTVSPLVPSVQVNSPTTARGQRVLWPPTPREVLIVSLFTAFMVFLVSLSVSNSSPNRLPTAQFQPPVVAQPRVQPQIQAQGQPQAGARRNPFFSDAACIKHIAEGYSGEGDVYLLTFDDVSYERIKRLYKKLSVQLGVRIEIMGCMNMAFDKTRQQLVAEELVGRVADIRQIIIPRPLMMGITSNDLYIKQLGWAWAFGMYELETGNSVISSARMDPKNFGASKDEALLETRLRKMIMRYLGLLYFKKPPSNDPKSVLYGTLSGVADLDSREERF